MFTFVKKEREKTLLIQERTKQFPTCQLSDDCKIINCDLGNNVVLHRGVILRSLSIGNHTYVAPESCLSHAKIGHYCSIGQNVNIGLWTHPSRDFVSTYPAFFSLNNSGCCESFVAQSIYNETPRQTCIGNDVWVGNDVLIPGGVTIGTGAIIGTGAVVTKDVAPYSIVAGNPIQLIRYRFRKEDVAFLQEIAWWNWTDDMVGRYAKYFCNINMLRESLCGKKEGA